MSISLTAKGLAQRQGRAAVGAQLFEVDLNWQGVGLQVVMGESGSGKSTLLKTLAGLWAPAQGQVFVSGHPLWNKKGEPDPEVLRRVGFAFQNNALFRSLRTLENLCFPHRARYPKIPEAERRRLASSWLKRVGLEASEARFPEELSGGMQKRLGLARTFMLHPDYLFLDDPTAGLDPITSRSIADLIHELLDEHRCLAVVVTNDADRARQWGAPLHYLSKGRLHAPFSDEHGKLAETFA
jgi:phospholipid/cholesterol/gamma-HCH transport system ATP-binding protein